MNGDLAEPVLRGPADGIDADIVIAASARAAPPETAAVIARAIRAAAAAMQSTRNVSVLIEDDAGIRVLNRQWRCIDQATNVLSFPAAEMPGIAAEYLGDIAISYETVAREAEAASRPYAHHLAHLAIHGFLHLLGYDHQADRAAEEMEELERYILNGLGIPDPYTS